MTAGAVQRRDVVVGTAATKRSKLSGAVGKSEKSSVKGNPQFLSFFEIHGERDREMKKRKSFTNSWDI